MNARRILSVVRRHAYETRRNPDRIADMLFWPMLDLVTWGVFSKYLVARGHVSATSPMALIGGIVLWGAFRAFQRDIAVGFLVEIWSRNVVGLFASPLNFGEYLCALTIVDLLKLAAVLAVVVIACRLVSGSPSAATLVSLLPSLLVLLVFGAATGVFVTGLILRFTTRVQTLAYGLAGALMPISCVFYPVSALPRPVQAAAELLPSTHAFEAMRAALRGEPAPAEIAWGLGLAALALVGALLVFGRVVVAARREGRLVRLI